LPHVSVSGDTSRANYSSMREGKLDFWPVLDQVQWNMLVPMLCRPAWRRVMQAAAGRGLQVSVDTGAKWSVPPRPWVNPVDDMKSMAGRIAMGLVSWRDEVTAQGYDPDELLAEIKEDLPKLADAGLSPTTPAGIAGDRLQQQQSSDGGGDGSTPAAPPAK
jgi:capsid protein